MKRAGEKVSGFLVSLGTGGGRCDTEDSFRYTGSKISGEKLGAGEGASWDKGPGETAMVL